MSETSPFTITVRPAVPTDAESIAHIFLESAQYHATLDPERYSTPSLETILARYRDGQQSPQGEQGITLVAELDGEIVGFIDVRLERSEDLMHREMIYSHVSEIAVGGPYQGQGVGARLMQAAEDWAVRWVRSLRPWNFIAQISGPPGFTRNDGATGQRRPRLSRGSSNGRRLDYLLIRKIE